MWLMSLLSYFVVDIVGIKIYCSLSFNRKNLPVKPSWCFHYDLQLNSNKFSLRALPSNYQFCAQLHFHAEVNNKNCNQAVAPYHYPVNPGHLTVTAYQLCGFMTTPKQMCKLWICCSRDWTIYITLQYLDFLPDF